MGSTPESDVVYGAPTFIEIDVGEGGHSVEEVVVISSDDDEESERASQRSTMMNRTHTNASPALRANQVTAGPRTRCAPDGSQQPARDVGTASV